MCAPGPTSGRCQWVSGETPLPQQSPQVPGATVGYPTPACAQPAIPGRVDHPHAQHAPWGGGRGLVKAQLARRRARPPGRHAPRLLSATHPPPPASQGAGAGVSANRGRSVRPIAGGAASCPAPGRKLVRQARGSPSVANKARCCQAAPRTHTCSAPRRTPTYSSAESGRG